MTKNVYEPDGPGLILKEAREEKDYSRDQIAERAKISVRYLTAIENEGRKPSYDVLFRLIRSVGISADRVFYPEQVHQEKDENQFLRLFQLCGDRDRKIIMAAMNAMTDNTSTE